MNNKDGGPSGSAVPTHSSCESNSLASNAEPSDSQVRCRYSGCPRMFGKVAGRSLHEKRAHPDWYDQQTKRDPVKARWNDEEHALLARKEAELSVQGVRFMNQELVKYFPSRSLESIKSHRKQANYKSLVEQFISEMAEESPTSEAPSKDLGSEITLADYDGKIISYLESLPNPSTHDFRAETLTDICVSLRRSTKEQVLQRITLYLLDTFPCKRERCNTRSKPPVPQNVSRRKQRRAEYARVQDLWKRNPMKCLRSLLKEHHLQEPPQQEAMVPFWEGILTSASDACPLDAQARAKEDDLWAPITGKEIRSSLPGASTAAGPDGVSARLLRKVPLWVLERVINILMWCGRLPKHLRESTTTLIPKKSIPENPGDFRPITVSSVIVRTFHKVLARRMMSKIPLDLRQRSFRNTDGCSENVFLLDLVLRYHHAHNKPLFLASIDVAKAFDSVSHKTIAQTLHLYGAPSPLVNYIMYVYDNSVTRLVCGGWSSKLIHPQRGVKQGDPLSPFLFNMVMDRLWKSLPPEIGVDIGELKINGSAFADDIILFASTRTGMQRALDTTAEYLESCGMTINASKSLTVSLAPVPHQKKTIVNADATFCCNGKTIPALKRTDEWRYLGVPFTPEGRVAVNPVGQLIANIARVTAAPLKPQQRLLALRVVVLPGLFHVLGLGAMRIGVLNKIDRVVRQAVRRWLCLPHDTTTAYFHANFNDGGLGIPAMRWEIPKQRLARLTSLPLSQDARSTAPGRFLQGEIGQAERRLTEEGRTLKTSELLRKRWANKLHKSVDGGALRESAKTPQQHRWVSEGNRFLTGRDFINLCRMRINALPTRSRTTRGRIQDRRCRGGCLEPETLNHILQRCHRTHDARIRRHNAIANYVARALRSRGDEVEEEPRIQTEEGLRKPDIIAKTGNGEAVVIDAQVTSEQTNLNVAHQKKMDYYKKNSSLIQAIRERYNAKVVVFETITLSSRGIWSSHSAEGLLNRGIIRKNELKVLSSRVLVGGLNAFRIFNATTSMTWRRVGVG